MAQAPYNFFPSWLFPDRALKLFNEELQAAIFGDGCKMGALQQWQNDAGIQVIINITPRLLLLLLLLLLLTLMLLPALLRCTL